MIANEHFNAVIDQPGEVVTFGAQESQLDVKDAKVETFARAVRETARGIGKAQKNVR
jgi:hypothetical protein